MDNDSIEDVGEFEDTSEVLVDLVIRSFPVLTPFLPRYPATSRRPLERRLQRNMAAQALVKSNLKVPPRRRIVSLRNCVPWLWNTCLINITATIGRPATRALTRNPKVSLT